VIGGSSLFSAAAVDALRSRTLNPNERIFQWSTRVVPTMWIPFLSVRVNLSRRSPGKSVIEIQ